MKYDIALIGLGVMGQSLARNMASKGIKVIVWSRHEVKSKEFVEKYGNENLAYSKDFEGLHNQLAKPRKYLVLVPAGEPVDEVINNLKLYLEEGDIIIDSGNSNYRDTIKRTKNLEVIKVNFVGMGISGGEEGALRGPSMMPGGSKESWKALKPFFEKIAAKDFQGNPCVSYMGTDGAGHYVKTVHNGIEYGVMQMMAETYFILKNMYSLSVLEIAKIFKKFSEGKLRSFLFDISVPILERKDDFNKEGYLIDYILDKAGQKGTGMWVAIDALERGISLPTITMAVFARNVSSQKERRQELCKIFHKIKRADLPPLENFLLSLEKALYAGMISSYAQGFELMNQAAKDENWDLNFSEITRIWQGGCIIRADLLNFLYQAFESHDKKTAHLFSIEEVKNALQENFEEWRFVVSQAVLHGIPAPALASSLNYFEEMTSQSLSANFIQGLRDYFGAHTYERTDQKGSFHTPWSDLNL